jgi:hypothetical protein
VTWTLTPHNAGPRAAPAGWSITQLLPDGVVLVSMTGDGYAVSALTATGTSDLPAGADGPSLTVTARLVAPPPGASTMRDVAYVAPAANADLDGDGVVDVIMEQRSPLVVPTIATDTTTTATDNDAQGVWAVSVSAPFPPATTAGDGGLATTGSDAGRPAVAAILLVLLGLSLVVGARSRARRRLR